MTKYIEVKLTEDQASKIIGALEEYYYEDTPENLEFDKYMADHNAFVRRLVGKIKTARVKARHQCDATCSAFSHHIES